jgi:hypothetical protein
MDPLGSYGPLMAHKVALRFAFADAPAALAELVG